MDLSRFRAAPSARLSHLSFEGDRAFPAQCRMATAWIVETIDVFKDGHLGLPPCFPYPSSDQLSLDGFEERLNGGIIIAISFAAH